MYLHNNNRSILAKCSKGSCWQLQSEYKTNKIIKLKTNEDLPEKSGKQSWLMDFLAPTTPANTYFA